MLRRPGYAETGGRFGDAGRISGTKNQSDMHDGIQHSAAGHRERWLRLLDDCGVGFPKSLRVVEVSGGLVQATIGEPPGRVALEGLPASVLMFNISPVQRLRQDREGRSFVSDMLSGEMTLLPHGIPSQWSWNSSCDRLDVMLSSEALGDDNMLEVVDRYAFRDAEMEVICRRLYHELSLNGPAEQVYCESLLMNLAEILLRRHSTASPGARLLPSGGLSRNQARRVLEYIEANLSRHLTLRKLSEIADLSVHHFARMFKQTVGVAPYRYVLERRLERAKTMLRSAEKSLVEISLSTGFDSQSHFASTFRRMVGATPTEFQGGYRRRPSRR
jgi:AraC family transcriptional regulator